MPADPRPIVHAQMVAADYFGVTRADILARGRSRKVVEARHVAMWLARLRGQPSFPELGRAFRRDHTTVMPAIRKIERKIATNPELARACADCLRALAVFEAECRAQLLVGQAA